MLSGDRLTTLGSMLFRVDKIMSGANPLNIQDIRYKFSNVGNLSTELKDYDQICRADVDRILYSILGDNTVNTSDPVTVITFISALGSIYIDHENPYLLSEYIDIVDEEGVESLHSEISRNIIGNRN